MVIERPFSVVSTTRDIFKWLLQSAQVPWMKALARDSDSQERPPKVSR
jgi:hypothetical protein